MKKLICCFLLSAIALFADVTGKWSGTAKGTTPDGEQTVSVRLDLKQTGNEITGTVVSGDSGDRFTITNGAFDGDVLTFKVIPDDNTTYEVKLTVKEDTMSGEATASHGDAKLKMKVELKRDS